MTGVLKRMWVLILVAGLLATLGWSAEALACPLDEAIAAPASAPSHDDGCMPQAPAREAPAPCAVCLAVLPALPAIAAHAPPPFAPFVAQLKALHGIDPALDPPPPRAA